MSPPNAELRTALAGVAGLLIDVDGVLTLQGRPIAGAAAALVHLDRAALPYLLATNVSAVSRATLASRLSDRLDLPVAPERIVSALSATAALTARRFPGRPLGLMATPDAATEFAGQETMPPGRAQADGVALAAVVVGDSPEMMGHDELDAAFRQIRAGARLVAMHRGPWWLAEHGPALDTGAYVAALEFATGRRAILGGKPAPTFFRQACARLGLPAERVAMIGDDPRSDVAGARRAGLRAVLVTGGKTAPADLDGLPLRARPEALATGLGEAVAALDSGA